MDVGLCNTLLVGGCRDAIHLMRLQSMLPGKFDVGVRDAPRFIGADLLGRHVELWQFELL